MKKIILIHGFGVIGKLQATQFEDTHAGFDVTVVSPWASSLDLFNAYRDAMPSKEDVIIIAHSYGARLLNRFLIEWRPTKSMITLIYVTTGFRPKKLPEAKKVYNIYKPFDILSFFNSRKIKGAENHRIWNHIDGLDAVAKIIRRIDADREEDTN